MFYAKFNFKTRKKSSPILASGGFAYLLLSLMIFNSCRCCALFSFSIWKNRMATNYSSVPICSENYIRTHTGPVNLSCSWVISSQTCDRWTNISLCSWVHHHRRVMDGQTFPRFMSSSSQTWRMDKHFLMFMSDIITKVWRVDKHFLMLMSDIITNV